MSWTNKTKNTTAFKDVPKGYLNFLLKEDSCFLEQENGSPILLEQQSSPSWLRQTKNTRDWTNLTKN